MDASKPASPRILIERCSDGSRWYSNKVGQYVPYFGQDENELLSKDNSGYLNVVLKGDGRVVFGGEDHV